jgi:transcriptional regulator with XRE-family HTH domain
MDLTRRYSPKQELILENWLKQIFAWEADSLNIMNLRYDFAFSKGWINIEEYRKNKTLHLEKWTESNILLRDIDVTENLLEKLEIIERINALAALYGYRTRKKIASEASLTESHIGKLLDIDGKPNPYPDTLIKLSLVLDVTEDHINGTNVHLVSNNFNNYIHDAEQIVLETFYSSIIVREKIQIFLIKCKSNFFHHELLFARVQYEIDFQTITVYNLNENTLEITDFLTWLGPEIKAYVITPAVLRKQKKVIYYKILNEKGIIAIQEQLLEMKKRKYTNVTIL